MSDAASALHDIARKYACGEVGNGIIKINLLREVIDEYGEDEVDAAIRKLDAPEQKTILEFRELEQDYDDLEWVQDLYGRNVRSISYIEQRGIANELMFASGVALLYEEVLKSHDLSNSKSLTWLVPEFIGNEGGPQALKALKILSSIYEKYIVPLGIPDVYLTSTDLFIAIDIVECCKVTSYSELYDRFEQARHNRTMEWKTSEIAELLKSLRRDVSALQASMDQEVERMSDSQERMLKLLSVINENEANCVSATNDAKEQLLDRIRQLDNIIREIGSDTYERIDTLVSFADHIDDVTVGIHNNANDNARAILRGIAGANEDAQRRAAALADIPYQMRWLDILGGR